MEKLLQYVFFECFLKSLTICSAVYLEMTLTLIPCDLELEMTLFFQVYFSGRKRQKLCELFYFFHHDLGT